MQSLLLLLTIITSSYLLDFNKADTNNWTVVNDSVMGGLSQSKLDYTETSVIFEGILSLANNGGFASFQGPRGEFDLSKYKKLTIRHRGFGGTFGFRLKTSEPFYMPFYKAEFTPTKDWQETSIGLGDFDEWRIGDKTGDKISKDDLASIIRMVIIKSDKKEDPFLLEVDFIRFE